MRITVGNLKGGVSKTTSSILLALALAALGYRVLLVDADEQGSASDWAENTEDWPVNVVVVPWATRDLAKRVAQVAGDYDAIVIDTGPGNEVIFRQALMVTDHLVVPVTPSPLEIRQLRPSFEAAAEVDAISPVWARVLLCKVRERSKLLAGALALLERLDLPTFKTQIHLWDQYIAAWATAPNTDEDLGEYIALLKELRELDETKEINA